MKESSNGVPRLNPKWDCKIMF